MPSSGIQVYMQLEHSYIKLNKSFLKRKENEKCEDSWKCYSGLGGLNEEEQERFSENVSVKKHLKEACWLVLQQLDTNCSHLRGGSRVLIEKIPP